ncbi:MAG TPA: glycosyltransferase family 4 protein [Thermoanaerobaculia bacterium]|nr:glycosyltransferase family 4 protein [Thermoanaerobaculia bacterium]
MRSRSLRITFVSGNRVWGGSEELWSDAAAVLAREGHQLTVFKSRVAMQMDEPRLQTLAGLGVPIHDLARFPMMPDRLFAALIVASNASTYAHEMARLRVGLAGTRPDLVVLSQGGNHDGFLLAEVCRRMSLPYVLLSQKASDLYWPADSRRARVQQVYAAARACYFVSEHNRRTTEEQLGFRLANAAVVRNPFLVSWKRREDWPSMERGVRIACIGRLYPMEKGQDLLLRVLARERWRERPLHVTFYGTGLQSSGLEEMARFLELRNVTFAGFVRDVDAIWSEHHALVLPSRCEGLPLVLVEAMLSGRVPIVTDVGGSGEVVTDDGTGFLAQGPSENSLDEAMERAWQRREEWRAIGEAAATHIRTLVPEDPAAVFASIVKEVAQATR